MDAWPAQRRAPQPATYRMLAHCTEKTNAPGSTALWQKLFARAGLNLVLEASGCCGMSGTYGHESRNAATSRVIFDQSWGPLLQAPASSDGEMLATGYSCRSQAKRWAGRRLRHPVEVLVALLREADPSPPNRER